MTIRDYLERRRNRIFFAIVGGLVAVTIGVYLDQTYRIGIPSPVFIVGFFAVAIIGLVIKQRIECPACHKPVGRLSTRSGDGQAIANARCPNCGVSIDEPMA